MTPEPDREIDALVHSYLLGQARHVDPAPLLARIHQTLDAGNVASQTAKPKPRRVQAWVLGIAAAAAVFVGFLGVWRTRPVAASAETLLREAKQVHAVATDRCYLVETHSDAAVVDEGLPLLFRPRTAKLWTRGDRFWIESSMGLRAWNWGRDESGNLWLAIARHRGIRFAEHEIPPAIALRCDVLSVRLETLLSDVLRDFDVTRLPSEDASDPPSSTIIRAVPKEGRLHPVLREATLVVDGQNKCLRKLVLVRNLQGHALTTTFTLSETATLADSSYELEGHLDPPYQVYGQDFEPGRRRQLMMRLFGGRAAEHTDELVP